MESSDQLHAPAADENYQITKHSYRFHYKDWLFRFTLGLIYPTVSTEDKTVWDPEPAWTLSLRKIQALSGKRIPIVRMLATQFTECAVLILCDEFLDCDCKRAGRQSGSAGVGRGTEPLRFNILDHNKWSLLELGGRSRERGGVVEWLNDLLKFQQ
jgi:hypothetical protein